MDKFIKLLDSNLKCLDYKIIVERQQCIIIAYSTINELTCPYCGAISCRVHSTYQREVQDPPLQRMGGYTFIEYTKNVL